jgi:hypothetical protein
VDLASEREPECRRTLARIIATSTASTPSNLDDPEVRQFARSEGVLPLLEWIEGRWDGEYRAQATVQIARRARLTRLLNLLNAEGVDAIVFKGAHLAYACYPDPALRPHVDTDLLIHPRDTDKARRAFERSGHRLIPHVSGRFVMSQFHFADGGVGGYHAYDVHWRISNPVVFRNVLPFDEVRAQTRSIAALGENGRGPSIPHALLIACVHRAAHHGASERLIWMMDIRLLLQAASAGNLDEFCRLAQEYRMSGICADACARAATFFGDVTVPDGLSQTAGTASEPSRAYLFAPSTLRQHWLDLRATPWRDRPALIREHLFPPAEYMKDISTSPSPLAVRYLTRMVRGGLDRCVEAWFRKGSKRAQI